MTKTSAAGTTPASTSTTTGCGFTQSVTAVSASQALVSFHPNSGALDSVIVHYQFANEPQQDAKMTYHSADGSWEYTISGLSLETFITYSFTYQVDGVLYDTASYSYVF